MYKTICIGPEQVSVWLSNRRYQLVVANSTAGMIVIAYITMLVIFLSI